MSDHTVTVEWEDGSISPYMRFRCNAGPESLCHAVWTCECEEYDETGVTDGRPWHMLADGYRDVTYSGVQRHVGKFEPDECSLRDWFENSDESLRGSVTFPVEGEWDGDSYLFNVQASDATS